MRSLANVVGWVFVAVVALTVWPVQGRAATVFFSDEAAWEAAAQGAETFMFTAANLLTADEVLSPPGPNANLGPQLSFGSANTGLTTSFVFGTLEQNADLVFDWDGGGPNIPLVDNALQIGEPNVHEDDDWELVFTGLPVRAFGFYLLDSQFSVGESFEVFGPGGVSLGSTTNIPSTNGRDGVIHFVGAVSTSAIMRVVFDESPASGLPDYGDDIAVGGVRFSAIPEPSSLAIWSFLAALCITRGWWRRRSSAG